MAVIYALYAILGGCAIWDAIFKAEDPDGEAVRMSVRWCMVVLAFLLFLAVFTRLLQVLTGVG